jgi:hypothetical protein
MGNARKIQVFLNLQRFRKVSGLMEFQNISASLIAFPGNISPCLGIVDCN